MTKPGNGESEALDRLEADDVVLEKILEEARANAARTVADARAQAEAAAAEARRSLEGEVTGIRETAAREAAAIEAAAADVARTRISGVRTLAAERRETAVALILRAVRGEGS